MKELRDSDIVATKYVESSKNLADNLTKCFTGLVFGRSKKKIVDFQRSSILKGHLYLCDLV